MNINHENILLKHKDFSDKIADSSIIKDQPRYQQYLQELKELEPIVNIINLSKVNEAKIIDIEAILETEKDEQILDMARSERVELELEQKKLQEELKYLLLPKDVDDKKNVILEIRAGTGGDEAAIFVADLFRMYQKYSESKRHSLEVISYNRTNGGQGMKEVIAFISGNNVYANFKHETGVHRVQRIPKTESNGRIHTSAVTVAVLPEVEEREVNINENELKVDTYRAAGAGGQHVNTTDSAVRITHIPTGTVVQCQDERSQQKNKTKAMKVLRARIAEAVKEQTSAERAETRKSQVGSGDRSERIRTYNYPQSRVTDHRINKTIHKLDMFVNGEMDEIITSLKIKEKENLLLNEN